jgi:hypothetical protein
MQPLSHLHTPFPLNHVPNFQTLVLIYEFSLVFFFFESTKEAIQVPSFKSMGIVLEHAKPYEEDEFL